jgi:hypothetical protein
MNFNASNIQFLLCPQPHSHWRVKSKALTISINNTLRRQGYIKDASLALVLQLQCYRLTTHSGSAQSTNTRCRCTTQIRCLEQDAAMPLALVISSAATSTVAKASTQRKSGYAHAAWRTRRSTSRSTTRGCHCAGTTRSVRPSATLTLVTT